MQVFLTVCGCVWAVIGILVLSDAKSAIHEILACLLFSFGIVFWAFAAALSEWRKFQQPEPNKQAWAPVSNVPPKIPPR